MVRKWIENSKLGGGICLMKVTLICLIKQCVTGAYKKKKIF